MIEEKEREKEGGEEVEKGQFVGVLLPCCGANSLRSFLPVGADKAAESRVNAYGSWELEVNIYLYK